MSLGNMNSFIDIQEMRPVSDDEGFRTEEYFTLATVRAYREGRHGSEKWANRASFTDATDLFRFRVVSLYLKYDTNKEYLPQLEANAKDISDLLDQVETTIREAQNGKES